MSDQKCAALLLWDTATVEQAVVRWVKDGQFGVSFLHVPPDVQARLAQVFQLLHEDQKPTVRMISFSPS